MINLSSELQAILSDNKTSLELIKKDNFKKSIILENIIKYGKINGIPKEPLFKELRRLGLSFPNQFARNIYDESLFEDKGKKFEYAAKLRGDVKPDVNKIPQMKSPKRTYRFLYKTLIYMFSEPPYKKIPRHTIKLEEDDINYSFTFDYVFWDNKILTKNEVYEIVYESMTNDEFYFYGNQGFGSSANYGQATNDRAIPVGARYLGVLKAY